MKLLFIMFSLMNLSAHAIEICNTYTSRLGESNSIYLSTEGKHAIIIQTNCAIYATGDTNCHTSEAVYSIHEGQTITAGEEITLIKEDGVGQDQLTLSKEFEFYNCSPRQPRCYPNFHTTYEVKDEQGHTLFTCTNLN
jgi:hypothetical protein